MAYVIWRVFMKKYSKIRLGMHRNLPVNPSEERPADTAEAHYVQTSTDLETPSTSGTVPREDPPTADPPGTAVQRKTSKAKRVKSYLKKCKDAALGREQQQQQADGSGASWYVQRVVHQGVEVYEEGPAEEQVGDLDASALLQTEGEAVEALRPGLDGPGDVLDSRTEGGTTLVVRAITSDRQRSSTTNRQTSSTDRDSFTRGVQRTMERSKSVADRNTTRNRDSSISGVQTTLDRSKSAADRNSSRNRTSSKSGRQRTSDRSKSATKCQSHNFTNEQEITKDNVSITHVSTLVADEGSSVILQHTTTDRKIVLDKKNSALDLHSSRDSNSFTRDREISKDGSSVITESKINPESDSSAVVHRSAKDHESTLTKSKSTENHQTTRERYSSSSDYQSTEDIGISMTSCQTIMDRYTSTSDRQVATDRNSIISDSACSVSVLCASSSICSSMSDHQSDKCNSTSDLHHVTADTDDDSSITNHQSITDTVSITTIVEAKGDVAGLVTRYLGPLYPNFARSRSVLVRQARDLLVCTFHGNLTRFEQEFLAPAADLISRLRLDIAAQGGDAVSPVGWPLIVGAGGVALHLGELDAALVRARDCYLCVRGAAPGTVEVALAWREGSSRALDASALDSALAMEDALPGLLQSLLVSVERALERVPLGALAFPCPACRQPCPCTCACVPPVQKRDTSIQTSPMFEYAGAIPHIDSDSDADQDENGTRATQTPTSTSRTEGTMTETVGGQQQEEQVVAPKNISELPDKLLMAGIHLPGTHDLQGRPLILVDVATVVKASLSRLQVASLLLYYASLPRPERMEGGVAVLVCSAGPEAAVLDLLDQALLLVESHVRVASLLLWRPNSNGHPRWQHKSGAMKLEASKLQCHIVSDDASLREFLSEDQVPANCGGRSSHDQLEWVEFHKELEPLVSLCHGCGRRLVGAMSELRAAEGSQPPSRRLLHHQHRALSRALADPELGRLRREGACKLERLQERAQWLPASEDVRLAVERARRLFCEVDRAARRLEQLSDGRRERLRDIARVRALEEETSQVLSWLCKKGEETLRRHAQLATNLPAIKEQEQDFEKFYFISMRHLDKGSDLLEEAGQCSGEERASSGGGLRDLARSLKQHLLGFSERLEDTRERLEDTSRCFCLLDKAYEWALETMKYMSRVKADEAQTPDQTLQLLKHLQQYLMAHPPIAEEHLSEMLQLARKLDNVKLLEQTKVAQSRCQETMELIREQQSRLVLTRQQLGLEEEERGPATSTPNNGVGRRRSVPFVYKCSHHAAGHACSCRDPTLGNIAEVRESAEDLLDSDEAKSEESLCARCSSVALHHHNRHLRRSCTWQYPTESFDVEDNLCNSGRLCGSRDTHKCEYSRDNMGDSTTEGSDGCAKSAEDLEEHDSSSSGSSTKCVPPVAVNSHLHCHSSSLELDLQSSLAAASTKELKTHKTLLLIMREMIQTERDYVKSLEYIIENYIPELLREDIPQALRGQRNVIFGNVEKIFEFHSQYFLQELERCENSPLQVGQCFLRHEKKFYLYALYNKNKPKSDSLMSEYGTSFFKTKQLELGDKMDLASYLLKPVQRMGKYALLLQQLMKAYPDKETDVADIRSAEKMVRFQLRHGNDLLAMDSLRDCDVNVKEQGRLLRQNEFLVWQGKGKKCLRHVFLFEDLILFSKARRFPDRKNLDLYIYKNSIKMTDIGLTAKIGDSPTKFEIWFRKRKPNDTFTLQSMSEEIKQMWAEEISKLLWKQALRNREMRLAEMCSMGIGNKPCLDIRPSKDQISDRSISIAQLSKTAPRFRNSITVSSGELLRSNKRPHSIISVSSSSSSGGSSSSHSSTSAYGALINLGFDPVDSPHMHHRSTTLHSQCSTESGIIADISLGSEDTDGSGTHWHVERSNSSVTSMSLDSSMSPTSPMSPTEENKTCLIVTQAKDGDSHVARSKDTDTDQEELSIKL